MQSKRIYVCRRFALKVIFFASVAFMPHQPANAQGPGLLSPFFLLFSPSAAANGIGSGFVAVSTEASAIHYNPAALARLGRMAIEGNTFKWLPDLDDDARYYYFAGAFQTNLLNGVWLGAAFTLLNFDLIFTDPGGPQPLGTFDQHHWALSFAAASNFGRHIRFGFGLKYVRINIPPVGVGTERKTSAATYALDLGFLYDGFLSAAHFSRQYLQQPLPWQRWARKGLPPGFSLGVALANVGPQMDYGDTIRGIPLPQNLRIGLAWNIFESDVIGLVASGEFTKILVKINKNGEAEGALKAIFTSWGDQSLREEFSEATYEGGVEVSVLKLAALRFGRHWEGESNFGYNSVGFSVGLPGLRFSFAKILTDDDIPFLDWRIYTASVVLDRLP
jgi:hypothetical protein